MNFITIIRREFVMVKTKKQGEKIVNMIFWFFISISNFLLYVIFILNEGHGNCLSLLRVKNKSLQRSMMILQESSIDASGAYVIYAG
ncbi:hypothetical protein IHE45_18G029700 [Dioscorea alata]|uniref:Uncharacterized protein n=1 Tax=Dioscorea alata TaxID=55571 RepID=A0ACB7U5W9_DIOAL|nr:hypothetical protein IHE45_18G029700 [Dioscorea alata]